MPDWRNKLDPLLREYLDHLISESSAAKNAYAHAKNSSNAQLWVALSILARDNALLKQDNKALKELVAALNQKYKFLEKAVREINPKKLSKDTEDPAKALKEVLKKL